MSLPSISIVIPSFNQAAFLERALESIAIQAYPHTEVIVVDGGSSDGTRELLERRADIIARWVSEPDRGQTHALNKGFAMATGSIRGWLNCDERYRPGALWLVANAFVNEPHLDIVFGHRIIVDEQRSEIARARLPNLHPEKYALFASGLLFSDTTFWTADLHARTGELNELDNPRYGMDFEWFARMSHHVKRWKRLDAYLSEFTQHAARVSYDVPEMPDIARRIRLQMLERAAMPRWVVALVSPFYLARTHYDRTGSHLFARWPSLRSVLRVAGYVR